MLIALLLALTVPVLANIHCDAIDGDTMRCGSERVRLLGTDAPELPGHWETGRRCAPGDPHASTRSLRTALRQGPISIQRFDVDRYGQTLALVRAGRTDLSCWQVSHGQAIYRLRWDTAGRLARICPAAR